MDSLVKIDGKPLEKLIEVVSNGIGTLYRPRAMRKEANAKAYEIKVVEKAKAEALAEGKLIEAENLDRLNERLLAKEVKRQNNIDDVVEIAASHLQSEPTVTEETVNEDWTTRFFDIVQDVSDDEMKKLWGQILAGEVKTPQSYSLRTLELLRNLSKNEADIFVKIARLALCDNNWYFIYKGKEADISKYDASYSDIAKLIEIGILQSGDLVQHTISAENDDFNTALFCCNIIILLTIKAGTEIQIPIYLFTQAGMELLKLVAAEPNMEYIKELADHVMNTNVKVQYSYILSKDGNTIHYSNPLRNFH